MKEIYSQLNKVFDSRVRLGIMSVLLVNAEVDFNSLKDMLDLTDGNLASSLRILEREGYIKVKKSFLKRKPNTRYISTAAGRKAFTEHLNSLEKFIRMRK